MRISDWSSDVCSSDLKAEVAAKKLRLLNPEIEIRGYVTSLSTENAIQFIEDCDVVLDCTDNFTVRYLLTDICMLLDKPLVFGAVFRYEGQLAVFNVSNEEGAKNNYRSEERRGGKECVCKSRSRW